MGYGADKVHFIGHGIGLELDEFPVITPGYINELKEGVIFGIIYAVVIWLWSRYKKKQ